MKRLIPGLAVLLILLLVPDGDLASRVEPWYRSDAGGITDDTPPPGDDHPWGDLQTPTDDPQQEEREMPRVATGVPSLDVAYSLPLLGSYLTSNFRWFCTVRPKTGPSAATTCQQDMDRHEQLTVRRKRVCR